MVVFNFSFLLFTVLLYYVYDFIVIKKKQKETKDSGKLAIRPDQPRRRIEVKVCMPGGLRCVVLYISIFSQPSIYIDGWLYAMSMTSVVCNVPVLSQNDSTYHHSVFTT